MDLRHAYCVVHGCNCNIAQRVANMHLAGTSCTAWSPAGLCDGATAMSHAHFLAWVGLRRQMQEPVIAHECTDGFPRSLFDLLLPMYNWTFARIDPLSYGIPVRRMRQLTLYLGENKQTLNFKSQIEILHNRLEYFLTSHHHISRSYDVNHVGINNVLPFRVGTLINQELFVMTL